MCDKYERIDKEKCVEMKITIIAGYYPPEQSADTRLNYDLAEGLAEKGNDVTVIVPFPSRGIDETVRKQYLLNRYEKVNNHLQIYRVGWVTHYKQNIFKRGIEFLIKSYQIYKYAKNIDTDIYFVVSTPPSLGYVAAKLYNKKKVIYKLQDVFPDSLMHTKNMRESSLLIRFFRILEKTVYKKVNRICTISDDLKNTLIDRGVPENKITVIYDWIDENKCYPIKKENNFLFDKFSLDRNKKYVVYAGNIGWLQNIKTVVFTAKRFIKTNPDLEFIIIGNGAWKSELDKMLDTGEYTNVRCFPMQPTEDIAYVYSLGDIGLVSLRHGVTKIALASKTWDIMSAGRAIICEIDLYSGLCNTIKSNKVGYCVSPGDVDGMEKVIREMICKISETDNMGRRGRQFICDNLTKGVAIDKYLDMFQKEMEREDCNRS